MQSGNTYVQDFLQAVCRQLRYKSIHEDVCRELADHIEDQKNDYLKQGIDEETAVVKAVEQMGNPELVGNQLNKTHRPRTEWSILTVLALLVLTGGAVQYFLSGVNETSVYMFARFLLYAPVGMVAFAVAYFFDYTLLERYSKQACLIYFAVMIVGLSIFRSPRGEYRQVYYLVMLFIPIFAGIITSLRSKGYVGIIVSGIFYVGVAIMCILAPSFSGLLLLTVCSLAILTVAIRKGYFGGNNRISYALVYLPAALVLFFALLLGSPYQYRRLSTMFNPNLDPLGGGWASLQVKHLLDSSRLFGAAVLEGNLSQVRIEHILPEWATDLSLTYLIARLGYVAGLGITLLMFILVFRMFVLVLRQKNECGFLVSFAASLAITAQIVLYILANFGVLAVYGSPLPFISFGGTGFVINMALIGLVLSVYRRTYLVPDRLPVVCHRPFISLHDGKLIIDIGLKSNSGNK